MALPAFQARQHMLKALGMCCDMPRLPHCPASHKLKQQQSTITRDCFVVICASEQCKVLDIHESSALCMYHGIHVYWAELSVQLIRELPLQKHCTFRQLAVVIATNAAVVVATNAADVVATNAADGYFTESTNSARQACLQKPFCCCLCLCFSGQEGHHLEASIRT